MNVVKVDKPCKPGYEVLHKPASIVEIKARNTDKGGTFYVYDLFDKNGICIALNRYIFEDNKNKPFEKLTKKEEDILNPTTDISEPGVI